MSCIDPKDIPQLLLPLALSRKKETDAIGTLNAYPFVSKSAADKVLNMHRLVHLAMWNSLRREKSLAVWAAKAMGRLKEVFLNDDHKNRNVWRLYLVHVRFVLERGDAKDDEVLRTDLTWKFARCLYSDGRYNEAEVLYLEVRQTRKRALGEEHHDTLTSMTKLALTYWSQGRWKEAEELEMIIVDTRKRLLGEEHPSTLFSMTSLGSTYRKQERWIEAEKLEMEVMETEKRELGQEYPSTLTSMGNLASTYKKQGRWKEAEELYVKVLEKSKRVLGEKHPSTLENIANIAFTIKDQGRIHEAILKL
jgi:tetratricopeptide (TPR) repeat protein